MNFRAGRDFKGDLVQPLHFINKEIEIGAKALPKVKHLVCSCAGNGAPSRDSLLLPPYALPDRSLLAGSL